MGKKVLIVDDSKLIRDLLKAVLEGEGYTVVGQAHDGREAIAMAKETRPDIITLESSLPDLSGSDILKKCRDEGVLSRFVFISDVDKVASIKEAIGLGAIGYLVKPFLNHQLLGMLNKHSRQP
jgi:two-component system, chemotaxis family, chemotaxis protein CheY